MNIKRKKAIVYFALATSVCFLAFVLWYINSNAKTTDVPIFLKNDNFVAGSSFEIIKDATGEVCFSANGDWKTGETYRIGKIPETYLSENLTIKILLKNNVEFSTKAPKVTFVNDQEPNKINEDIVQEFTNPKLTFEITSRDIKSKVDYKWKINFTRYKK